MFPRVSVQDIFFLPLLIFHDSTPDSLEDRQRLLPARVFPLWEKPCAKAGVEHRAWKPCKEGKNGAFFFEGGKLKTGLFGRKRPGTWRRLGSVARGFLNGWWEKWG